MDEHKQTDGIFEDDEARNNLVGLFDLLYKIDLRLEPERYEEGVEAYD